MKKNAVDITRGLDHEKIHVLERRIEVLGVKKLSIVFKVVHF